MLALGLDMDEFDNAAEKFNTFSQFFTWILTNIFCLNSSLIWESKKKGLFVSNI